MRDVVHAGEICDSERSYVFEVHDVDFIMPCGVVFACFIASWIGECYCGLCVFLSMSVFVVYFMFGCVGE